jgi:hypothetical protein
LDVLLKIDADRKLTTINNPRPNIYTEITSSNDFFLCLWMEVSILIKMAGNCTIIVAHEG